MDKEIFLRVVKAYKEFNDSSNKVYDILHIEIMETVLYESFYTVLTGFLESNFNKEGVEWVEWYLYERLEDPSLTAWTGTDKEIKLGFLKQEPELDPEKTVYENILDGMGDLPKWLKEFNELSEKMCDESITPEQSAQA